MTLAPAQLALIAGLEAPARSGPERVVPLEGGRPGLRVGARDGQVRDRTGHVVARVDLVRDDDGLTERETAFVDELVAAMVMGDLTSVRALWVRANPGAGASRDPSAGLEVLRRERVQAAVRSRLGPAVQAIGPLAVACLVQLLQHGKSEQVRLAVAQFVLAENGVNPAQRVEVEHGISEGLAERLAAARARVLEGASQSVHAVHDVLEAPAAEEG